MFTCIFALARTVGWIAQWNEMISDPEHKIGRPRQLSRKRRRATARGDEPIEQEAGARRRAITAEEGAP